jgi:hypothetical protein
MSLERFSGSHFNRDCAVDKFCKDFWKRLSVKCCNESCKLIHTTDEDFSVFIENKLASNVPFTKDQIDILYGLVQYFYDKSRGLGDPYFHAPEPNTALEKAKLYIVQWESFKIRQRETVVCPLGPRCVESCQRKHDSDSFCRIFASKTCEKCDSCEKCHTTSNDCFKYAKKWVSKQNLSFEQFRMIDGWFETGKELLRLETGKELLKQETAMRVTKICQKHEDEYNKLLSKSSNHKFVSKLARQKEEEHLISLNMVH